MSAEMEMINPSGFHGEDSPVQIEVAMLSFRVDIEAVKSDKLIYGISFIASFVTEKTGTAFFEFLA